MAGEEAAWRSGVGLVILQKNQVLMLKVNLNRG